MREHITERIEYADDRRRKGSGRRLVKLPGETGYTTRNDSPDVIAARIRLDASEKRHRRNGGK